jgi:hypothetical protein
MRTVPVLIVLALAVSLCLPVTAAPVNDTAKAIILSFHYLDGTVTPVNSRVIYGYPPDNIANRDLLAEMVGKNNAVLGSYGIEEPRVMYTEDGTVMKNDVTFSVIMPFSAGGQRVDLYDGATRAKLASADITGAYSAFCAAHGDDPDCAGGSPLIVYIAAVIVCIIIAGGIYLFMKRKKPAA